MQLSLVVSLLAVAVDSLSNPTDIFLPYGSNEGDSVVPVGDDTSSPAVDIPTAFPFLNSTYSTVYVSIKMRFTDLIIYVLIYLLTLC